MRWWRRPTASSRRSRRRSSGWAATIERDAYAVLGVGPSATQAELKAAHRALVLTHHPDVVPEPQRAEATRRVQEINVAYGLVRDPRRRAAYDRVRRVRNATDAVQARRDAAAREWERMVVSAGRWAGGWWRRHRAPLRGGATRMRVAAGRGRARGGRMAAEALGRVLWLVWCVAGTVIGWLVALSAQRLLGIDGVAAPLAGALGGLALGNQRGWQQRLRLIGVRPAGSAARLALLAWLVVVGAALWLDRTLT